MALKQGLQLKLGQSLTMTPQLQQAIKLLQLSALDLQQEVYDVLESNPMLEVDEEQPGAGDDTTSSDSTSERSEAETSSNTDEPGETLSADSVELQGEATDDANMPEDLPVDTSWDDVYDGGYESAPKSSSTGSAEGEWDFTEFNSAPQSLQDSLLWQLNLANLSDRDRIIGETIIDAINSDGMLDASVEDLRLSLSGTAPDQSLAERAAEADNGTNDETRNESTGDVSNDVTDDSIDSSIDDDEIVAVLKLIQQFEPTGVGARDLSECLLLQLDALPDDLPYRAVARSLISEHMDTLAARDFVALKRRCKLDDETLTEAIRLIQSLNPRPGSAVSEMEPEYIVPDVLVKKVKGRWNVELNPETTPKLRINDGYAKLIRRADTSRDNTFLKDNLQEARWFMKSLQSRHETLLKVATKIVEHQRGFLEYGPEAMKPLVLHDIAQAVDMHESTISRVTSRKYMHTPRGIFELKYFFSSHVGTTSGGEVSSTAIRALIQKLTAEEDTRKPLSDSKLAAILKEQNIQVARRTVAKYRESMGIPPSNERKRLL
ncbi:MAG: RNA polymerase factor sigma-54 [Pseudomonadota bacterium]